MSEIDRHLPTHTTNVEKVVDRVTNRHPEYDRAVDLWTTVEDCLEGERRVKEQGDVYLPRPNPSDTSAANQERYRQYVTRAVFYNVVKRTLQGLTGRVFSKDGTFEAPEEVETVAENIDGSGVSIEQQSKDVLERAISVSRCGLMVDFPETEGAVTRQQATEGGIRPTISVYAARNITNWKTTKVGSETKLSLVVLYEQHSSDEYEFSHEVTDQYRQLLLEDGIFKVRVWRKLLEGSNQLGSNRTSEDFTVVEEYTPLDAAGRPFNEILFTFIGAANNDSTVDVPLMLDLATLNLAHFRNSADYEESCFIVGQPTPYFTGLTEEWFEEVLKGKVHFGSRAGIPLPENATAGLLQADSNTMIKEAMESKEDQMVALGARLIESSSTQRTATEASLDNVEEVSALVSVANNVSEAYRIALGWFQRFISTSEANIDFRLNTDFSVDKLDSQQLQALVATWQSDGISWTELRAKLRASGIATEEDEAAKDQIEGDNEFFQAMQPDLGMPPGSDDDLEDGE